MNPSEAYSVKEELDRKTVETLNALDGKLRSGLLTSQEFRFALEVISDVGQGLIDNDVMAWISNYLAEDFHPALRSETQIFSRSGDFSSLVLFHWDEAKSSTAIVQLKDAVVRNSQISSFEEELAPTTASRAVFDQKLAKAKEIGLISLGEML